MNDQPVAQSYQTTTLFSPTNLRKHTWNYCNYLPMVIIMDTDELLWSFFEACTCFTSDELCALQEWQKSSTEKKLVQLLVQTGIFKKEATNTLSLISKGFIQGADISMFFAEEGIEKLKQQLDPGGLCATETQPVPKRVETDPEFVLTLPISQGKSSESREANETPQSQPTTTISQNLPHPGQTTPTVEHSHTQKERIDTLHSKDVESERWDSIQPGMRLGRCVLIEMIGKGTFGMVFRALHQTLNITVAVKILHKKMVEQDPVTLVRLKGEAQLLAQLNHPNIVRILDFDDGALPFIVLEMVEGLSLSELIHQCGGMRTERALPLFIQIAHALDAALEYDIVHRDVKPANILVTKKGVAKLADLGLAVVNSDIEPAQYAQSKTIPIGTSAYICPEQVKGDDPIDFRSDIYSLGVSFYHTLSGRIPFRGRSSREVMLKHVREEAPPLRQFVPDIDPRMEEIIRNMMAKDPNDRYQSYAELIDDLNSIGKSVPAPIQHEASATEIKQSPEVTGFWRNLLTNISKGGKK